MSNENNKQVFDIYPENAYKESLDFIFIINIAKEFIKESFKICDKLKDYPFAYNEEQSKSALIPAIHKICDFIWLEQPMKKKKNNRYIDLATEYNNSIYFFEVKQDFINTNTNKFTNNCCNNWENVLKQIGDITYDNMEYFKDQEYFYRVAFMILPTRHTGKCKKSYDSYSKNLFNIIPENLKPNLVISYELDKFNPYENNIFTYINFIIKIDKIRKSKQSLTD